MLAWPTASRNGGSISTATQSEAHSAADVHAVGRAVSVRKLGPVG